MTCQERQRALISGLLSEEDVDHLQNCDACVEAVISMQLKSNADAAFAGRRASSTQLLVWKSELRQRRVQQEQVAFMSRLGVQLLCLGGLGATVAAIGFSFSLRALAMDIPTYTILPELFGAALIVIVLCAWAVRAAFGELTEFLALCAQRGLHLKNGSSSTI
jgi:hypothetical protein